MFRGFAKYRIVYSHMWKTYGASWPIRFSFLIQIAGRICKLVVLPVAISLLVTKLAAHDYTGAYKAVALFVSFSLLLGILTPLIRYVGMFGENVVYRKSTENYFSRLITADIDYLNSNLAGYLTTATRQYVDGCVQLERAMRDRYVNTLLSIVFPLAIIIWIDPWLGLVALLLSVLQAGYLLWASSAIDPWRTKSQELFKSNSGQIADAISNVLPIRASAQEAAYTDRIKQGAYEEADVFKKRWSIQARLIAVREFITVSFFMVLLWLVVQRMSGGHISITAAVLVVTYTTTILNGIYALSDDLDEHDNFIDKILPAFEILNRKNAVNDPARPKKLRNVRGEIQLQNISFAYDNGRPVFRDFSLHIPSGQKIGIVGLSGAGKSTLTKLLLRFNDVDKGEILLDGTDIKSVKQINLREQIAYVPQEPLLFHSTIKENVLLARPNASDKEVLSALRAAHALHFVAQLPEGINSIVGERGVKLSGGQKQRVAIARAVLRHAPIMVLDEATSALDSESEQIIKDSFAEILKGKTAIVIAHRLSTLSEMDRIVVIEKGKLTEDGTHQELLAKNGAYARAWKRQQRNIED